MDGTTDILFATRNSNGTPEKFNKNCFASKTIYENQQLNKRVFKFRIRVVYLFPKLTRTKELQRKLDSPQYAKNGKKEAEISKN